MIPPLIVGEKVELLLIFIIILYMKSSLSITLRDGEVSLNGFESDAQAARVYKELVSAGKTPEPSRSYVRRVEAQVEKPKVRHGKYVKWTDEENDTLIKFSNLPPRMLAKLPALKRHSKAAIGVRLSLIRRGETNKYSKSLSERLTQANPSGSEAPETKDHSSFGAIVVKTPNGSTTSFNR